MLMAKNLGGLGCKALELRAIDQFPPLRNKSAAVQGPERQINGN